MRIAALIVLLSSSLVGVAQSFPAAAPGLNIPSEDRPWIFENHEGKNQLIPLHTSAVQADNHRGGNLAGGLLAGPFYKVKFTTELQGTKATTVVHVGTPVLYLHLSEGAESGQSMMAGWAVVHAVADKDRRLLSTVKFTQLTGRAKRNDTQVDVDTEQLPGGWLKMTPKSPLEPGEYVLEPVMKQENAYALMVYDFRVDPAGENNADVVTE